MWRSEWREHRWSQVMEEMVLNGKKTQEEHMVMHWGTSKAGGLKVSNFIWIQHVNIGNENNELSKRKHVPVPQNYSLSLHYIVITYQLCQMTQRKLSYGFCGSDKLQ